MADTIIDRVFIAFGLKTDDVQKGMSKAENIVSNGLNRIKDTLMPIATGFALASMVTGFVEGANQIEKASQRLGMTAEDLQAWQGAAEALGAEGAEVNEMLSDMNEHLVDMVQFGSGPAVDILNKLGISAKDAAGKIRPAADVLLDLAGASEKVGKQNMLAYGKMMGFNPEVIDLLLQGRKGLEDLLKAQKELAVFNKEDAEIAKQSKIAWQGFMKSLQAIQAVIMRAVMPSLVTMVNWLTKAVVWARQNQPFIIAIMTGLALLITKMLIPAMLKMGAAGWASMAPLLPWIALITALALTVDDLWTYFEGGENALPPVVNWLIIMLTVGMSIYKMLGGSLIPALGTLSKFIFYLGIAILKILIPVLISLGAAIWTAMAPLLPWLLALGAIAGAIYYVWDAVSSGKNILDKLKADIMSVVDTVNKAWTAVEEFFGFSSEQKNKNEATYDSYINPLYSASPEDVAKINGAGKTSQTNNINTSASIGSITINTQAADASGIAKSINPAIQQEFSSDAFVMAANTGVILK